jgi:arylsulfatase A-like enzyme
VKRWERTAFFVDQTVEFLGKQSTKPGFVFLWLDDPHSPWVPDAEKPRKDTPASLRRVLENMDFQIGRLLDRLDAIPQGKNTLVLFISDNGPRPSYQGKRTMGLRGEKLSLYEGGIRLPCLVRWPGVIAPGGVDDSTVLSAVDMLPTLAAAAGAQVGNVNALDGENQIGAFRGQPRVRSRPLFWEYGRNDKYFDYPVAAADRSAPLAMREGHYKLLCKPDGNGVELFNLAMDPKEQSNIAETQNEIATSMKAKLLAWWRSL